jgi:beta-lactam-binding protein with PASTA domain
MIVIIKANTLKGLLIHAMIAVGLLFILALVIFQIILPVLTNKGETVTVPDLKGMSIDEVNKFTSTKDLAIEVSDSAYDSRFPPQTVLEQYPEPNSRVKIDRKINLTLNAKRSPNVPYPDVAGSTSEFAQKQLKSFGFTVGSIQYRPDIAHNAVLESRLGGHTIKPGDKVPKGSSIELVIGKHTDRFPMPDIKGMQADEAETYILGMNLKIKAVHLITDETGTVNTIQRHLPQAGDTVRAGDEVELWIHASR